MDANIDIGEWNHIALVSNSLETKIFVNGRLSEVNQHLGAVVASGLPFGIGARYWRGGWLAFLKGSIDDLKVYNRALSEAEVSQLYMNAN